MALDATRNRSDQGLLAAGTAPAKVILAGEHAVVYGHAAVACPVRNLQARVRITAAAPGAGLRIDARDLGRVGRLSTQDAALQPLAQVVQDTLTRVALPSEPDWILRIQSRIPVARGLGSGAAVACATVRAVAQAAGKALDRADVNALVWRSEERLHGTPSGIDNQTVVHDRPLLYRKGRPPVFFDVRTDLTFLLADTGVAAPTSESVKAVARLRAAHPDRVETWMREIGDIGQAVCAALRENRPAALPGLLNRNQALLRQLNVSAAANENLIRAALDAGALAAKITGAGMGGQVLVLVGREGRAALVQALRKAGARAVIPFSTRERGPAAARVSQ